MISKEGSSKGIKEEAKKKGIKKVSEDTLSKIRKDKRIRELHKKLKRKHDEREKEAKKKFSKI